MPKAKPSPSSLHAPEDKGGTALLVIDMMSTWDFPDAARLLPAALAIAPVIARLRTRCRAAGLPVIYANDNFGRWRSDWRQIMCDSVAAGDGGARIAELLAPDADDYFVLKPMHSAFFATPLQLLLQSLGVRELLLTGITADQCVLATAIDAHMQGYDLTIPRDAVAAPTADRTRSVLRHLEDVVGVRTTPAARLRLRRGNPPTVADRASARGAGGAGRSHAPEQA